ncbi:protein Iojap, chloroplastic [Diospyros lotus]|uniref:protein Iojap, chloroplastic n=1 Tax=Diospyros lotus TaxID=55363 RepID=UPI00224E684B|nr:protein Iojap, chloroplastic [Diospyros lotus]
MLRLPEPTKAMESPCSFLLPHSVPCVSFAGNRLSSGLHLLGHGEFKLCLRPRSLSGSFHRSSMFSRMALGPNVSEDTDDMFDELFKKYGKVVFKRNDQKAPSAEVDDDAESLSFAIAVAKVASDVKAADIRVLFVKPLVYWTRFFIIATAFSRPQIDAIGTKIKDLAEKQYGKVATGDAKPNSWTLLDFVNNGDDPCAVVAMIDFLLVCIFFAECIWQASLPSNGDVVVHIFLPPQRALYNLEEFYGNATPIELPFENQQPFRS